MSKALGGPSSPVAECDAFVVDCHSDVMIDVLRRRREGESNVLESTHLPRLRLLSEVEDAGG